MTIFFNNCSRHDKKLTEYTTEGNNFELHQIVLM